MGINYLFIYLIIVGSGFNINISNIKKQINSKFLKILAIGSCEARLGVGYV